MRARYLDNLVAKAERPNRWVLVQPFRYVTEVIDDTASLPADLVGEISDDHDVLETVIRVPAGFDSDLASIPQILRSLIPGTGLTRWAAVIHDALYDRLAHRKTADKIFREAMKTSGVAWWKRTVMYLGVRSGGWVYYRRKQ